MNHCAECGKVLEMGDEGNIDRISSLPDELLVHILSSVSTLIAAQTSILSTRWRYLFTLTSNLSFDDQEYFRRHRGSGEDLDEGGDVDEGEDVDEAVKTSFERFVYGVLASHKKSPIEKFSLSLGQNPSEYDCSHLHEWISAAIAKKVRHLHLGIVTSHANFVPDCAFNSDSVVVLEIFSYDEFLVVPQLVCLPKLTTLELYSITFWDADSTKRLFAGFPQLTDLTLRCCELSGDRGHTVYISAKALQNLRISWCRGHVVIDAPNLVNLTYECQSSSADLDVTSSLKNPCSLDRVELCFASSTMYKLPQTVLDVITGAVNVRELILMADSLKLFTRVNEEQQMPYSKLECLHLDVCYHDTWKYVTFLLANSPQLEAIIFEKGLIDYDPEHDDWPANMALAPFSSNVKTIEVHRFGGSKPELLVLKFLLENAGALKRLIIYKLKTMKMEEELEISKALLMFPKASTDFTIELETDKADDN